MKRNGVWVNLVTIFVAVYSMFCNKSNGLFIFAPRKGQKIALFCEGVS